MTEIKHTPGPWFVDGHNTSNVIRKVSNTGSAGTWEVVARVQGENWLPDARLIAAAPDLLKALYQVFDDLDWDGWPVTFRIVSEAIAKAEDCRFTGTELEDET